VPKDAVRGTNAVLNILQTRILFYIAMGVLRTSEAPLYAICVVSPAPDHRLALRLPGLGVARCLGRPRLRSWRWGRSAVPQAGSVAGTLAGNSAASKMDQRMFSRVLVALMLTCCVLMFCSAAGIGK
jgi:hypothetical protein